MNSRRYGSRSSAATTSRRASRSVATIISSRKPGCPRFSASTSEYRRPMAAADAAPRRCAVDQLPDGAREEMARTLRIDRRAGDAPPATGRPSAALGARASRGQRSRRRTSGRNDDPAR